MLLKIKNEMHEHSHVTTNLAIHKPNYQNVYFVYGYEQESITECCNQVACTPASQPQDPRFNT